MGWRTKPLVEIWTLKRIEWRQQDCEKVGFSQCCCCCCSCCWLLRHDLGIYLWERVDLLLVLLNIGNRQMIMD